MSATDTETGGGVLTLERPKAEVSQEHEVKQESAATPEQPKLQHPQKINYRDFPSKKGEGIVGVIADTRDEVTHASESAQFLSRDGTLSDKFDVVGVDLTPQEIAYMRLAHYGPEGLKRMGINPPNGRDLERWQQSGLVRPGIDAYKDYEELIATLDATGREILALGDIPEHAWDKQKGLYESSAETRMGRKVQKLEGYLKDPNNKNKSVGVMVPDTATASENFSEQLARQRGGEKVFVLDTTNTTIQEEELPPGLEEELAA